MKGGELSVFGFKRRKKVIEERGRMMVTNTPQSPAEIPVQWTLPGMPTQYESFQHGPNQTLSETEFKRKMMGK